MRCWGLRAATVIGMIGGLVGCTSDVSTLGAGLRGAQSVGGTETRDWQVSMAPAPSGEIVRPLAAADEVKRRNTGWRVGLLYVDGDVAEVMEENGAGRWLFGWGYQFEIQRGAEGETNALVEFIPLIVGIDQSMIIPFMNMLVGLRFPNGLEFTAGPHYASRPYTDPRYEADDVHLWGLGFTVGFGYTFETNEGRLRIPVGVATSFAGDGMMASLTIGWNMKEW